MIALILSTKSKSRIEPILNFRRRTRRLVQRTRESETKSSPKFLTLIVASPQMLIRWERILKYQNCSSFRIIERPNPEESKSDVALLPVGPATSRYEIDRIVNLGWLRVIFDLRGGGVDNSSLLSSAANRSIVSVTVTVEILDQQRFTHCFV